MLLNLHSFQTVEESTPAYKNSAPFLNAVSLERDSRFIIRCLETNVKTSPSYGALRRETILLRSRRMGRERSNLCLGAVGFGWRSILGACGGQLDAGKVETLHRRHGRLAHECIAHFGIQLA